LNRRKKYFTDEYIANQTLRAEIVAGWPSVSEKKKTRPTDGARAKDKGTIKKGLWLLVGGENIVY
jgi:hypothetical protein